MILDILNHSYSVIFLAGAVGALVADVLKDNALVLPKKIDGTIFLGCFGGFIVGGFAGLVIDGSPLTAFMGGFMGKEVITRLVLKKTHVGE